MNEVREALDEDFGVASGPTSRSNSIGPTFGAQIARTALIAIIASLLLISIYIALRFEAKFAVPVLIAVAHDILITGGVYALVGREVTTSTVAALLTILGYSLYDTIIVFDRIRENVPRMPRATFSQIVNRSMSEVFTRSLATSVCTLFPVAALMLFGGETLRDFAFALLVGIASGAYSSIFIAVARAHAVEGARAGLRAPAQAGDGRPRRPRAAVRVAARSARSQAEEERAGRRDPAQARRRRPSGTGPPRPATAGAPAASPLRRRGPDAARCRPGSRGCAPEAADGDGGSAPSRRAATARASAAPAVPVPPSQAQARLRSAAGARSTGGADMSMVVWVMMGIALWHFAVFVPDRFWGGIVGAFLAAIAGAVLFGLLVAGLTHPRANDTGLEQALIAVPGAVLGPRGCRGSTARAPRASTAPKCCRAGSSRRRSAPPAPTRALPLHQGARGHRGEG